MTVTNLNKVRKAKARADKKARASENSVRFGQTKDQKTRDKKRDEKARQTLDAHLRDD